MDTSGCAVRLHELIKCEIDKASDRVSRGEVGERERERANGTSETGAVHRWSAMRQVREEGPANLLPKN